jgi:hypothetical protein
MSRQCIYLRLRLDATIPADVRYVVRWDRSAHLTCFNPQNLKYAPMADCHPFVGTILSH